MTDTTPNPAPEPTPLDEAAAAAAASPPTYSPPTTAPETPPEPAAAGAQASPVAPPAPVIGLNASRQTRSGGITGGVILIALGVVFLASEFVPGFDIGKLWPLILVAIGIGIILRRR